MSRHLLNDDEKSTTLLKWLGYLLNDCITDDFLSNILSFVTLEDAHQLVSALILMENDSGCKVKRSWQALHFWKELFLRGGFALDDGDDCRRISKDDFWQLHIYRQRLFQRLCHINPVQSFASTTRSTTKVTNLSVPIPNFIPVEFVMGGPSGRCSDYLPHSTVPFQFQLVSLATGSSIISLHQKPCTKIEQAVSTNYEMMTTSVVLLPKLLLNLSLESYGDDLLLEAYPRNHILLQLDHRVVNHPIYPTARLLPCKQLVSTDGGSVSILFGCAVEECDLTDDEDVSPVICTKIYIWCARFGDSSIDHEGSGENWRHLSHGTFIQMYFSCRVPGSCTAMDYHCQSSGESKLYLTKISPHSSSITLEVYSVPRWDDHELADGPSRKVPKRLGVFDVTAPTTSHCSLDVDSTGHTVVIATPDFLQVWNMQAILEKSNEGRSRQDLSDSILYIPIMKRIRDIVELNQKQTTTALHSIMLGNIDNPRIPPRPQQRQAVVDVHIYVPRHLPIHEYGFITLHTNSDVNENHHLDISHTSAIALPYLVVWEFQQGCGAPSEPQNHHQSSWIVSSVINLPLLSMNRSKPMVQYDGRRIIVFGQDFLGYIILVYQFARNHCDADGNQSMSRDLQSRLPPIFRNGMEESGGVYNFTYPSIAKDRTYTVSRQRQRPRRFVKFVKRIRHDALHGGGTWDSDVENQSLQMSCNERFLVFRTKRGDRLRPQYLDEWPSSFSDGFLYFDLNEGSSP